MYLDYFGFDEPPFSITPDPKFVFLSKKHEESLAHLVYGITRGGGAGFVQLTGEVGTGKTTISRLLLEKIPEKTNIALILNPTITPLELLQNICQELKIPMRGIKTKLNALIDKLNKYLLDSWSNSESTVVIIDEAQNLPRDTLEQLRLLTNLETDTQKLLQIILIGQPELRSTMRRNDLRQLAQRVTARYHLMPLDAHETFDYLQHRIQVAGASSQIIPKSVASTIYKITQGVPRLINILTDRALLAAYSDNKKQLNNKHIKTAAIEVMPETYTAKNTPNWFLTLLISSVLVALSFFAFTYFNQANELASIESSSKLVKQVSTFTPATTQSSWSEYFKLWDAKNDKNWNKAQCPQSKDTGMACLRRQGNLNQILKLNHPVLLHLEDKQLVLLTKTENNKFGLLSKNTTIEYVDKAWIEKQWFGSYFIIWPMPAELLLEPNTQQLNSWALEMSATISSDKITASELQTWLKLFQDSHGLQADGIIGSETQMALSLKAYNGPTLK